MFILSKREDFKMMTIEYEHTTEHEPLQKKIPIVN